NDAFASAQSLQGAQGALGAITASGATLAASNPAFTFENISATGTVISALTGADDASVSIPIGFTFPFYGSTNTSVFVCSNGFLSFGISDTAFTNADLSSSPSEAVIAPYWDDLIISGVSSSSVMYQLIGSGAS